MRSCVNDPSLALHSCWTFKAKNTTQGSSICNKATAEQQMLLSCFCHCCPLLQTVKLQPSMLLPTMKHYNESLSSAKTPHKRFERGIESGNAQAGLLFAADSTAKPAQQMTSAAADWPAQRWPTAPMDDAQTGRTNGQPGRRQKYGQTPGCDYLKNALNYCYSGLFTSSPLTYVPTFPISRTITAP